MITCTRVKAESVIPSTMRSPPVRPPHPHRGVARVIVADARGVCQSSRGTRCYHSGSVIVP
jgi:hypothetical protein